MSASAAWFSVLAADDTDFTDRDRGRGGGRRALRAAPRARAAQAHGPAPAAGLRSSVPGPELLFCVICEICGRDQEISDIMGPD